MRKSFILLLAFFLCVTGYAQKLTISGVVIDKDLNEPLTGVNVLVKGTTTGTITDFDGKYTLAYIIHSGFISGYQNRYGDNLKPPTNVYHRMTA